jgi:hypothetical protein
MDARGDRKETNIEPRGGVSRRGLLKVIAAAGGTAAAAAVLPDRWLKPMIQIGATPAHAQTSVSRPVILGLTVGFAVLTPPPAAGVKRLVMLRATFGYEDPLEELDDTATLSATLDPCGAIVYQDKPLQDLSSYLREGDAGSGTIGFDFPHLCTNGVIGELCVNLTVKGRTSDILCGIYNTLELPV